MIFAPACACLDFAAWSLGRAAELGLFEGDVIDQENLFFLGLFIFYFFLFFIRTFLIVIAGGVIVAFCFCCLCTFKLTIFCF